MLITVVVGQDDLVKSGRSAGDPDRQWSADHSSEHADRGRSSGQWSGSQLSSADSSVASVPGDRRRTTDHSDSEWSADTSDN